MSGKSLNSKGSSGKNRVNNNDSGGGNAPSNQQSRYQRQMQGKQGQSSVRIQGQSEKNVKSNVDRDAMRIEGDDIDSKFGFDRMKDGPDR